MKEKLNWSTAFYQLMKKGNKKRTLAPKFAHQKANIPHPKNRYRNTSIFGTKAKPLTD